MADPDLAEDDFDFRDGLVALAQSTEAEPFRWRALNLHERGKEMVNVSGEAASAAEAVLMYGDWLEQTKNVEGVFNTKTWHRIKHPIRRGGSWARGGIVYGSWKVDQRCWKTKAEAAATDLIEILFDVGPCCNAFCLVRMDEDVQVTIVPKISTPSDEDDFRKDLVALVQTQDEAKKRRFLWRTVCSQNVQGEWIQVRGEAASKAEAVLAFGDWLVESKQCSKFFSKSFWKETYGSHDLESYAKEIPVFLFETRFDGMFGDILLEVQSDNDNVVLTPPRTKAATKR